MTARGNPGLPFYFLFTERNGAYRLTARAPASPKSAPAYEDLMRLSLQDIKAPVKETQRPRRVPGNDARQILRPA